VKLKILKQFTKEIKIKTQNQKKTDQIWNQNKMANNISVKG
jgi:hypothetical protein